jgi:hypothetical protein
MNPRYQIFISSTFRDLKAERQAVLEAVLELGHFPAGMEIFPAANATPWTLIETIIKESDYYVLIVGGMYGTTDKDGVSYTEREYDLALASGLPILGFLHGNPADIPAGRSEMSPESRKSLEAFRQKVQHHHCKYWLKAEELKAQVVVGLVHTMRVIPRVGWVRTDKSEDPETLKKLTLAMEENVQLQNQLKELRDVIGGRGPDGQGLASGSDPVILHYKTVGKDLKEGQVATTWDSIFLALAPGIISDSSEFVCRRSLDEHIRAQFEHSKSDEAPRVGFGFSITGPDFDRVMYQFIALDYVEPVAISSQSRGLDRTVVTRHERGFKLTKQGARAFAAKQAIRKSL